MLEKKFFKIICFIVLLLTSVISLSSCANNNQLLLLNWGEYINEDLVREFEEEYNCSVSISVAESNELFYSKIKSGTTAHDLVIPSDYMVEKMYNKGLLQPIDFSKLPNYDENNLLPGAKAIIEQLELTFEDARSYLVPYLWGTFGLMYNKNKEGLEESIINNNGWAAYFNHDLLPSGTKVGMYNVPRFTYATTMFYQNMSPNIVTKDTIAISKKILTSTKFNQWGTDQLKKQIASGNLDLAYMYTGDFLDQLYIELQNGTKLEDISFDIYIPDNTIAFMDNLVIPKKARHVDLAHKFINFMIKKENAYLNSSVVGYCTPYQASYDMIVNWQTVDEKWKLYFNEEEYGSDWLKNWSYAMQTYYPLPKASDKVKFKGTVLSNKNITNDDLTDITNMVNNAKVN